MSDDSVFHRGREEERTDLDSEDPRSLTPVCVGARRTVADVLAEINKVIHNPERTKDEVAEAIGNLSYVLSDDELSPEEAKQAKGMMNTLEHFLSEMSAPPKKESSSSLVSSMGDSQIGLSNIISSSIKTVISFDDGNRDAAEDDVYGLIPGSQIRLIKPIGEGGFGCVYRGTWLGIPVAVKLLKDEIKDDEVEKQYFMKEIQIMARLRHPNICEYLGYTREPLSIINLLYPYTLYDVISSGRLTREDRYKISYQIVSAVAYMHSIELLHRDLKPANILVDEGMNAKVGDFGLTMKVPRGLIKDKNGPPGSDNYMAPEMLLNDFFDASCEVFAIGLIIYGIFTGRFPTDEMSSDELKIFYYNKTMPILPVEPAFYTGEGKPGKDLFDILTRCCSYDRKERQTLRKLSEELLESGVGCVITKSKSAKRDWIRLSNGTYMNHIPLQTFVDSKDFRVKDYVFEDTLKKAVPPTWDLMSINHFWYLSCWFPFFYNSMESFTVMNKVVYADWYACDMNSVNARLDVRKEHQFLVRPSTTDPFSAPFTISYVEGGKILNTRIRRGVHPETKATLMECQKLLPKQTFPSLEAIVAALNKAGFLPPPPPAAPTAY